MESCCRAVAVTCVVCALCAGRGWLLPVLPLPQPMMATSSETDISAEAAPPPQREESSGEPALTAEAVLPQAFPLALPSYMKCHYLWVPDRKQPGPVVTVLGPLLLLSRHWYIMTLS